MPDSVAEQLLKAEITLFFERVGTNDEGEPLYRLKPWTQVKSGAPGGGETIYKMPIPKLNFLGDKFEAPYTLVVKLGGEEADFEGVHKVGAV